MARQSFIWTALPNGYTADGIALRVSAMLAPRLDPQHPLGEPQSLDTFFPDWEDWPATLATARFDVSFGGQTVSVAATATTGANRVDDRYGLPASAVWKALFTSRLLVQSFEFTDLSSKQILSYDAGRLTDMIESLYRELARNATDRLPTITELFQTRGVRELVAIIAQLDHSTWNPDWKLRDPDLWHPGEELRRLPMVSDEETLARFQAFHTPPAKPIPRTAARKDDNRIQARWLEYQRTELPPREKIAEDLDFHRIVAALGSYPVLLRRLGLVVDLLLDPSAFVPAAATDLSVKVVFPAGALVVPRTSDAGPATRTRLTATHFDAVPGAGAQMPLKDRLLDLGAGPFRLLQLDVDGSGLKLMNLARSLGRRFGGSGRVDSVSRHEHEMGVPALRSGGLTLVQTRRDLTLRARFVGNKARNSSIESQFGGASNDVVLHAEDIVRGYRIDIWDSVPAQWRSLCRRTAAYELDNGVIVSADPEEETTVRLAATKASDGHNPERLYLHEALVSWTGWSLAAPPPGRAIGRNDGVDETSTQSAAEVPPGLKFRSTFQAVKGSLPRLRFGRSYRIRARAVDLAGNSLEPQDVDFGGEQPVTSAQTYLRYEPIAAPVIALLSTAGTIAKPAAGESMLRVAIRSFNDTPADNLVATSQVAVRAAAPPQVSVREAEQHGMLDLLGKLDSARFDLLAHQKDIDPADASAAIREVALPMQGPLDMEAVATTFAVYEAGRAMTYLPDPLAVEVVARFFDHPNVASTALFRIPLYPTGTWPEAQPFAIELYDDPLAAPHFDADLRLLRVPLPKGCRAKLRLSMAIPPTSLPLMGVFALLSDPDRAAQRDRASDGQHWMLTPWTTLELVHAVQRPLVDPAIVTLTVLRQRDATWAMPVIHAKCSVDSTARLDLFGEWHEPSDDPGVPDGKLGPVDRRRQDCAFQAKITAPNDYAASSAGSFPEHTVSGDLVGINTSSPPVPPTAHQLPLPDKAHEFHDTRYRRIEYWFDATTRFREFLPSEVLTTFVDGEKVPTEERIRVTGARSVTWVPSSAPPPAPRVLYVVPTFGWKRTVDEGGTLESRRGGGGLRVYLDRGWNASGYGEMLGVVLPAAGFSGDPDTAPAGTPYKNCVTLWGNDPIWDSAFVPGIAPTPERFPRARTAPDPGGAWLPPGAPDSEKDQRPGAFAVTGLPLPGVERTRAAIVDVAPHDVYFDAERQLWYCDIEIDPGSAYFPFVRLALSRYQPTSVDGAHLSNVVLADIMALTADRWLNITPETDSRALRVAVFGVSYYESSAHYEAEHSRAVSLVDPLTGEVKTLQPAKIAERTVVEVWVERLTPEWGDDFGWQRVGDAIVAQRGPSPGRPEPLTPVASLAGHAATRIQGQASGDSAVALQVTDVIRQWQTLWEGTVTLSDASADARHRLVIAEYEEYLVDDDQPYDRIPTAKGRRLVFVEHVEFH